MTTNAQAALAAAASAAWMYQAKPDKTLEVAVLFKGWLDEQDAQDHENDADALKRAERVKERWRGLADGEAEPMTESDV